MSDSGYTNKNIPNFHRMVYPYIASKLKINKNSPILEIGAGQGHSIIPLLDEGWIEVSAIDIEDINFKFFKENYGIECMRVDMSQDRVPVEDESFDYIHSSHVIEHLSSPDNFLNEIYRLLRPGGSIAIVTPDWKKWWRDFYSDPTHLRPYDKEGMSRLLRMHGFKNIEVNSFGSRFGIGRCKAVLRLFPKLCFIGRALIITASK